MQVPGVTSVPQRTKRCWISPLLLISSLLVTCSGNQLTIPWSTTAVRPLGPSPYIFLRVSAFFKPAFINRLVCLLTASYISPKLWESPPRLETKGIRQACFYVSMYVDWPNGRAFHLRLLWRRSYRLSGICNQELAGTFQEDLRGFPEFQP